MDSDPHRLELEAVLGDYAWLQRFARSLVRDEHSAEDLVQMALEQALSGAKWQLGKLPQWLKGTLRNLSLKHYRGLTRRLNREARNSLPETDKEVPTADMLAGELESRQLLSKAVNNLPEPYRETILLHYMRGMSLKEIGRHMGVETRTIESRLYRGRQQVREQLTQHYGKDSFALILLPLLYPSAQGGLAAALGKGAAGAAVQAGTLHHLGRGSLRARWLGMGAIALLAMAMLWWRPWSPPKLPLQVPGESQAQAPANADAPLGAPSRGPSVPSPAGAAPTSASATPPAQEVQLLERGSGAPMAGLPMRAAFLRPATAEESLRGRHDPHWFRPRERVWWRLDTVTSRSDADGLLYFHPPPEATELFLFLDVHSETHSIEDYSRGRRVVALHPAPGRVTLDMVPRHGSARGRVVDPQGQPLLGAEVLVTYPWILPTPQAPQRQIPATDGHFRLSHLANDQGGFLLMPHKNGFVPVRSLAVMRMANFGESEEDIELVLAPERPRQVQVLDASGQAIGGATLLATPTALPPQPEHRLGSYRGDWRAEGLSDGAGRCLLHGIPDTAWTLEVSAPDQLPWRGQFDANQDLVEVRLPPQQGMPITVTDEQGQPLAGATVVLFHASGQERLQTDPHGHAFGRCPPGSKVVVAVVAPGHAAQARTVPADTVVEQLFRLPPALTIRGRLRDWPGQDEGRPPPQVFLQGPRQESFDEAIQDHAELPVGVGGSVSWLQLLELDAINPAADGSFVADYLLPNDYLLWAGERFRPLGFAHAVAGERQLLLTPGDGMANYATLHFQVEDALSGRPVPAYYLILRHFDPASGLWVRQPTAVAQAVDGRYRLAGLLPGLYQILVWAPTGFVTQALPPAALTAGEQQRLIRLQPSTSLRLRLVDTDGTALGGVVVSAQSAAGAPIPFTGDTMLSFPMTLSSRPDGSLTLSGIPRDVPFELRFDRDGHALRRSFTAAANSQEATTVVLDFSAANQER